MSFFMRHFRPLHFIFLHAIISSAFKMQSDFQVAYRPHFFILIKNQLIFLDCELSDFFILIENQISFFILIGIKQLFTLIKN